MLGCAPAQRLLEDGQVVTVKRLNDQKPPRRYADYSVVVDKELLPRGVEMLDMDFWDEQILDEWFDTLRKPEVSVKSSRGLRKAKNVSETAKSKR